MKILVTGAYGFIASELIKRLREDHEDCEVIGIVRDIKESVKLPCRLLEADLSRGLPLEEPVDVIFHIAAVSPRAGRTVEDYVQNNIIATAHVVRYAKAHHVKRVIYTSSTSLYGDVKEPLLTVSTPICNPSDYGMSKYFGEKLILEASEENLSVVLPGVLGVTDSTAWLIRTMENLREDREVSMFNSDHLFNAMVCVSDLVDFLIHLMEVESLKFNKMLVGADDPIPVSEVVSILKRDINSKSVIRDLGNRGNTYLIDSKEAKCMGYHAESARSMIEKFVQCAQTGKYEL